IRDAAERFKGAFTLAGNAAQNAALLHLDYSEIEKRILAYQLQSIDDVLDSLPNKFNILYGGQWGKSRLSGEEFASILRKQPAASERDD
ncbi:hypothetical protein, partial [Streptococcus pneumoniae]|uniref:hypothetical protein n=1 Tax=Streptococcus pneumoniae TaxID=1313 RepID=UPI0018B05B02